MTRPRSRAIKAAGVVIALCGLAGCDRIPASPATPRLIFELAEAESCTTTCRSVRLKFGIENPTDAPMCFSIRHLERPSKGLFLFAPGATHSDNYQVLADDMDPAPDVPGRQAEHVAMLRAEPKIYVAPRATTRFETSTGDKYEVPKTRIDAILAVYVYPCAGGAAHRLQEKRDLSFPAS